MQIIQTHVELAWLAESAFQLLQVASLKTLFVVDHEELMVSNAPSQYIKSLKAYYGLTESKFDGFERDSFVLHHRLDEMYPFMKNVNLHGSLPTLVGRVAELEGMLEEGKKCSRDANIMLKALSSSSLVVET